MDLDRRCQFLYGVFRRIRDHYPKLDGVRLSFESLPELRFGIYRPQTREAVVSLDLVDTKYFCPSLCAIVVAHELGHAWQYSVGKFVSKKSEEAYARRGLTYLRIEIETDEWAVGWVRMVWPELCPGQDPEQGIAAYFSIRPLERMLKNYRRPKVRGPFKTDVF